jgi:hypothetical protein
MDFMNNERTADISEDFEKEIRGAPTRKPSPIATRFFKVDGTQCGSHQRDFQRATQGFFEARKAHCS